MRTIMLGLALGALALTQAPALADETAADPPAAVARPDPARLAAARVTVDHIFPVGTYARIMDGSMNAMMEQVVASTDQLSLRDIMAMSGRPEAELEKLGKGTLADIMRILDPAYQERMTATTRAMIPELSRLMTRFEPAIRDGLATAYARRYTAAQLADMNRFFATPSGKAYAADVFAMFMDPAVMERMRAFMPEMMKQMPAITATVRQATAGLPPPRKYADLTPDERKRLAALLNVREDELESRASKF